MNKLTKLADAYEEALECDYCGTGEYQGLRPDEIVRRIIDEIRNGQQEKNDRALEALLVLAFREESPENITEERIADIFNSPTGFSKEDKKAIASWGPDLVDKILKNKDK